MIDVHSKWIEAFCVSKATSSVVIDALRGVIARFGLLEMVVTDSGKYFVSREIEDFFKANGIKHLTSAPIIQPLMG